MPIDSKMVKEIRDNVKLAKDSDKHNREAYRDNLKFLNLEQWDPKEEQKRQNKRLMITCDQLNAPVDQTVNRIKQNKPGPAVAPSGQGTDKDDAQIFEGILRRIDYENRAWIFIENAFENATGGNFGCWEADISYKPRSFERIIEVKGIPDANECVYFDPMAKERDRSDAMWAFTIKTYSKAKFEQDFPQSSINKMGSVSTLSGYFGFGDSSMDGWVTKDSRQVCKYWKVEITRETLRRYSNKLNYYDSEKDRIPEDVTVDKSQPKRIEERRQLRWYITDGVDILEDGDWEGEWIPLFPVYGRERWVGNKRYVSSMIQGAKQAQQAFNYAFTGACEVLAFSTKAPWVGLIGQFKSKFSQWRNANTEPQSFMEYDEVLLANGQIHVAPPQRNMQEPPVQAFLAFCQVCINAIQRATSVFDPSLGKQKSDQSGRAIQELQQQSTEGNFHWSDNLTIALTHYYRTMLDLAQNEYDAEQVIQILRADGTPQEVRINADFDAGTNLRGETITKHYRIARGNFAVTVNVGPSADSQLAANESKVGALIKVLPPELVAQAADIFIKLQNYGPLGDQLADRLTPPQYRNQNDPAAAAQHLAQAMQQNQQLMATVQKLQMAIATKQPELEVRKWIAAVNAIAGIEETKLKIGDSQEDREQSMLEQVVNLSHDATMQTQKNIHDAAMTTQQQMHEGQQNQNQHVVDISQAKQQQEADAEQPEPAGQ